MTHVPKTQAEWLGAGIEWITVDYDGSWDEGRIENIQFYGGPRISDDVDDGEIEPFALTLAPVLPEPSSDQWAEAAYDIVYEVLDDQLGNWYDSIPGNYGRIIISVRRDLAFIDNTERVEETNANQYQASHVFPTSPEPGELPVDNL